MAIGLRTIMRVIIVFTVVLISTVVLLKIAGYTGPLLEWNIFGPIPGDSEQPLAATPQLAVNIANAFRDSVSKEEDEISFEGMPEGYSLVYGLVKGEGDTINPISFVVAEKNVRLGKQDLSLFGLERRGDGIAIEDDKKAFQVSDESEFFWQMKSSYLPEGIQDCFDNPSPAECELEQEPDIYVTFVLSGSKELYYSNRHNVRRGSGSELNSNSCNHDSIDCYAEKLGFKLFYSQKTILCSSLCINHANIQKDKLIEILQNKENFDSKEILLWNLNSFYDEILIYGLYKDGSKIRPAFLDFSSNVAFDNVENNKMIDIIQQGGLTRGCFFEFEITDNTVNLLVSKNDDKFIPKESCTILPQTICTEEQNCALKIPKSKVNFDLVSSYERIFVPFSENDGLSDNEIQEAMSELKDGRFLPVLVLTKEKAMFLKRQPQDLTLLKKIDFRKKSRSHGPDSDLVSDLVYLFNYTPRRALSEDEKRQDPRNKECHGRISSDYLFYQEQEIKRCPLELFSIDLSILSNNDFSSFFESFTDDNQNKIRGTIDLYHFRPADENEWKIIGFFSTGSADNPLSEPEFKPYLLTLEDAKIPYINQLGNIYFDKYSPNEIQHLFYGNSKKDNSDFIDGYFENRDISFKYYIQRLYSDDSSPGFFIYYSEGNGFPNNFYPLSDDYIFYPVILLNNEYAYYRTWSSSVFNLNKFDNFLLHYLRIPPQDVIESLDSGFYYKYSRHALETQSVFLYSES